MNSREQAGYDDAEASATDDVNLSELLQRCAWNEDAALEHLKGRFLAISEREGAELS